MQAKPAHNRSITVRPLKRARLQPERYVQLQFEMIDKIKKI